MKISKVVLLIIMLIVVSCGGGQKTVQTDTDKPDWVDRGGGAFPADAAFDELTKTPNQQ